MATTFRRRGSQRIEFSLYVGTAVALMDLYSEEWYRRFPSTLMKFFPDAFPPGVGITDQAFVGVFPLAGHAGEYVGGMLTAPIPLTVALAGIYRTVRPGHDDVQATAMVGP